MRRVIKHLQSLPAFHSVKSSRRQTETWVAFKTRREASAQQIKQAASPFAGALVYGESRKALEPYAKVSAKSGAWRIDFHLGKIGDLSGPHELSAEQLAEITRFLSGLNAALSRK